MPKVPEPGYIPPEYALYPEMWQQSNSVNTSPGDPGTQGGGNGFSDLDAQIASLYQQYYGRAPSNAELVGWRQAITTGRATIASLTAQLQKDSGKGAGTTGTGTGGTGGTGTVQTPADWQAWFMALVNGKTPTPSTLVSLEPELTKYGVKVLRNGAGIAGKIQLPGGEIIDVIQGASAGGQGWQWLTGNGGGGDDGPPIQVDPSYLEPWTKEFTFGEFQAPTAESIKSDPGYLFRRGEAVGTLQNSAAAKGLLNSGGTLYDIMRLGDAMAGQEFQNAWDRNWGMYSANRDAAWRRYTESKDTWFRNQNEPWNKLMSSANAGRAAAST